MNQKSNDCIVVIPTHKETMTSEEERSFRNTIDILHNRDIALVLREGVSPDYYENIRAKDALQFQIVTGRPGWMGSVERYNDMALSPEFYQTFKAYKYILICHLDVWVFRDELQMWIDKGYDYIGAPWFLLRERGYMPLETLMYPQGGNGGFSLRKVDKMIELTSKRRHSLNILLFCRCVLRYIKNKRFDLLKRYIRACREVLRDADALRKKLNIYEDIMFCLFYSLIDKNFHVAPAQEEIYFVTEVYSEEILKTKLRWQLPFAIHGYDKYLPSITSIDECRNDENRNNYTKKIRYGDTQKQQSDGAPLITVVTATCNLIQAGRTETFRQCMESVHQQTYNSIEHIIIDGASSDGTLELIQEYVDKGWCVCFSEPDEGLWDALYKGHQWANGQFVNYMNSDDYFCRTDAIEIAVNSLVRKNADWFFSEGMIMREDGTTWSFPTSLYGVFSCMGILHQTMLVRTDILRAMNPFHSNYISRENYLMILLYINRMKYAYSKESLVHYREGGYASKTYGESNVAHTINDFGKYFYDSIGRFWGMTEDECRSMYTWQCFRLNGVGYSYRLSKKLRMRGLRFAFRKKLAIYVYKNIDKLLLGKLKQTIIYKILFLGGTTVVINKFLKAVGMKIPKIRRIVSERDNLQASIKSVVSERDNLQASIKNVVSERDNLLKQLEETNRKLDNLQATINAPHHWIHHRLHGDLNASPTISSGMPVQNRAVVERLLRAYQSSNSGQYGKDSMWMAFFNAYHSDIHKLFMENDVEKAYLILSNPQENNMFYGFDELCQIFQDQNKKSMRAIAQREQDNLIRLAEALGAVEVENPESTNSWQKYRAISTDEIVDLIESALGTKIYFPDIYSGQACIKSSRGPITYRSLQSLYLSIRLLQVARDYFPANRQVKICEIGAGLGRSAFFAHLLGLKNYTLVDIPMTAISQGYYLTQCLGEDSVVLPGEKRKKCDQIKIIHPDEYFASGERYDIVANMDSMSELGHTLAKQYLRNISATTNLLLSINSEANPIRVFDLIKGLRHPYKIIRSPFWMRRGYVEELVRFRVD